MNKYLILGLVWMLFMLTACSNMTVTSDVSETADFSQYKTYSFLGWAKDSDKIMNDLDKARIQKAFKNEFTKRGLTYVKSDGDMAVSLFIVVSQENSTIAYTNYYSSYANRYRGYGNGWSGGMATTTYREIDYLAGTLVMDVFDEASGDMIWQGVASGTVTEDPVKRKETIPKNVAKLMAKFPVQPIEQ